MEKTKPKLEWDKKYSVDIMEIDNQHKRMFATINELIGAIDDNTLKENLDGVINQLYQYKKYHFAVEEKYFKEFNYEETDEHIAEHKMFGERIDAIRKEFAGDSLKLAFELVDYLEDWLIEHIMTVDQKYKECFKSHGLK